MKYQTALDILQCLETEQTPYQYSSGDYALHLLKNLTTNNALKINQLKNSAFAPLLQKPKVKKILSHAGNAELSPELLNCAIGDSNSIKFNITHGIWSNKECSSRWNQTTRGKANLVLQLNWDIKRTEHFQNEINKYTPYTCYGGYYHPISKTQNTLAWARIDCDLDTGEALIEEIQSDWIRGFIQSQIKISAIFKDPEKSSVQTHLKSFLNKEKYTLESINTSKKIWAEATLNAAINFIQKDLGITQIYYHTFESGCHLKRIDTYLPPKSLYTDLPKRFCLQPTTEIPKFLTNDRYFNKRGKSLKTKISFLKVPIFSSPDSSAAPTHCLSTTKPTIAA